MQTETLHLNSSISLQKTPNTFESKTHEVNEDLSKQEALKRNQLVKSINELCDCV